MQCIIQKMVRIFYSEETRKEWLNENYKFLVEEYGKENIVSFVCHLDENTPHIHAITIPLTEDGRLSAQEQEQINEQKLITILAQSAEEHTLNKSELKLILENKKLMANCMELAKTHNQALKQRAEEKAIKRPRRKTKYRGFRR